MEGLAGDGDAVDPGLELARDGEIVHRRTDHHDVRRQELVEHAGVGKRLGEMRGAGIGDQVAGHELLAPVRGLQLLDDRVAESARLALFPPLMLPSILQVTFFCPWY